MNKLDLKILKDELNHNLLTVYKNGPKSLVEPINYVLSGEGKRLRPILTFISANACGGNHRDAFPAAISVEILHNFTLIHDDIMDNDNTRQGKKTVHEKWDSGTAILAGDAMLSLAMINLQKCKKNNSRINKIFVDGLLAVCEGQAIDKSFETKSTVSIEEYIKMIDYKTGHLIGMSAEIGALSVSNNNIFCKSFRKYGRLLGRAFQIQDDLLELYSDAATMGKSLDSDFILRKKTYPMIRLEEEHPIELNNALKLIKRDVKLGKKSIQLLLLESGIKNEIEIFIIKIISDANELMKKNNLYTSEIKNFSSLILERKK